MLKSQIEINLMKQVNKSAEQGIIKGYSTAKPGMNEEELGTSFSSGLRDMGIQSVRTLDVKFGKWISPDLMSHNQLQDGDFLSITLSGWLNNFAFNMKRVNVIGQPTAPQRDYLEHLVEATNWMIQTIVPGRKMTFYPAESRGRLISPIAYELDSDCREISRIIPGEQFILPIGMVLCIAPSVNSPEFGTMVHSEMIVLVENGAEILT